MLRGRIVNEQRVTFEVVLGHLRKRDFAVLSTVGTERKPHAVGVNYGVSRPGRDFVIYVMTRTHLQKARNIAQNPNVSLVHGSPPRAHSCVSGASGPPSG